MPSKIPSEYVSWYKTEVVQQPEPEPEPVKEKEKESVKVEEKKAAPKATHDSHGFDDILACLGGTNEDDIFKSRDKLANEGKAPNTSTVTVMCGPILGSVTHDTAVVLLEVDEDCVLTCVATSADGKHVVSIEREFDAEWPLTFFLEGLNPAETYTYTFEGLADLEIARLNKQTLKIRTFPLPEDVKVVNVLALSCDRPARLSSKDFNPWDRVDELCKEGMYAYYNQRTLPHNPL